MKQSIDAVAQRWTTEEKRKELDAWLQTNGVAWLSDDFIIDEKLQRVMCTGNSGFAQFVKTLPENMTKVGSFDLQRVQELKILPRGLSVEGGADISHSTIEILGSDITVGQNFILRNTKIKRLPERLKVKGNLDLVDTQIKKIPRDSKIEGNLYINKNNLELLKSAQEAQKSQVLLGGIYDEEGKMI